MSTKPHPASAANTTSVVIIGAGHAGLAVSRCLSDQAINHVLIERGEVANAWKTERWKSLHLLTPNWQNDLPGFRYDGDDPQGFMACDEVASFISEYASAINAPVQTHTTVTSVTRCRTGYRVQTDRGVWFCQGLVLASGSCNEAKIPPLASQLPAGLESMTPLNYRSADQLAKGGVLIVGASATGVQLADEIRQTGRKVTLSVGEHIRLPRMYRERDIHWWMDRAGILDQRIDDQDDPLRARRLPSPQLIGSPNARTLDLNALQQSGVAIVGRLATIRNGRALFSGSLRNCCALADQKQTRLLDLLDQWATEHDLDGSLPAAQRPTPTQLPDRPKLHVDLNDGSYSTVIWATGFRPDYSWLQLPVIDQKGSLIHEAGVVGTDDSNTPGLYAMGLPFMRRRQSAFIQGAKQDAREIVALMNNHLKNITPTDKRHSLNTHGKFDVAC